MAIIKCKMCGGDLNVSEDMTVAECEYCGTKQTVPKVDDEKKLKLFERANRLRAACEFDKAAGVYESIVSDFEFEAEAYWGLVLCKYGIEYVDDPATKKKVPTCHRSSFESVQDDPNYEQALENADLAASSVYRKEAFDIEELRKGIIEVSSKEEPYDIFISYKELAENGDRTVDSVIAQDIYTELTERGYRVFFSRISLEDKLGTEYEPYIFAALNSAKLMLVVGTSFEHFNAVWVKNEWSRFLSLIASGKKKTLIPCFKDINPYDMPKEFAKLSAQDMGKVGAMQDLMRGVEKIIPRKKEEAPVAAPVYRSESDTKTTAAMKRGTMALEDGDFAKADEYFEQVLTLDAECAEAYWGKVLAAEKCRSDASWVRKRLSVSVTPRSEFVCPVNMAHLEAMNKKYCIPSYFETQYVLCNYEAPEKYEVTSDGLKKLLDKERYYYETDKLITRAEKFSTGEFKTKLSENMKSVLTEMEKRLSEAEAAEDAAVKAGVAAYARNIELGNEKVKEKYAEAVARRDKDYEKACKQMKADTAADYQEAIRLFKVMAEGNYKDCAERIKQCEARLAEIKAEEKKKADAEAAAAAAAKKKKNKKIGIITGAIAVLCIAAIAIVMMVIIPNKNRSQAYSVYGEKLMSAEVGDTITFGNYYYYQDNWVDKKPISWVVLAKEDNKLLVISQYAIDGGAYNDSGSDATWKNSTLRAWLNSDFLDYAFDDTEKSIIANSEVPADKNPKSSADSGNATTDKVFLLSVEEAEEYFSSDSDRKCHPTAYSMPRGAGADVDRGTTWWWLRSPGADLNSAAFVDCDGTISYYGLTTDSKHGIRPAMWIEIGE